jgi:putative alpha-1,2-mannosidase
VIGSPIVDQSIMFLPGGKSFRVIAQNNSDRNKYIQSATLNGKPYTKSFITHANILDGGVLQLEMGSKPGKKWGTKITDVPSSMSLSNR